MLMSAILKTKTKQNMKKETTEKVVVALFALTIIGIITYFFTLWTDRNLDYIVSYFKGHPVDVPMWLSFLTTVALNAVTLLFNVICEILKFIL